MVGGVMVRWHDGVIADSMEMSVVAAVLSTSGTENMPKPWFCIWVLDYARA